LSEEADTTLIGWQGISARLPADWMLAAVGGDRRSGYLRVDYEGMARLQVKWASRHIDLEKKRAEYLKRLEGKRGRGEEAKRRKGGGGGVEVTTDLHLISRRAKPKKDILAYGWRPAETAESRNSIVESKVQSRLSTLDSRLSVSCGLGVLWNCEVCGRAVIAQLGWPVEEEAAEIRKSKVESSVESGLSNLESRMSPFRIAQRILESLEDHGIGGWDTWGVDGLVFLAPSDYELDGWRRMTRYLELRLLRKQEKLKVARWGMVPLVLGELTVRQWYDDANRQRRDVSWASEEADIKGHDGIVARGQRRRLAGEARTWAARALRWSPAVEFEARAWHCPQSNRLYLVEALYGGQGEGLHGAVESIVCHEE
jgi:hypothetical protein